MKTDLFVLCMIGMLTAVNQSDSQTHWPMHGHDARRTGYNDVDGPTAAKLKWTFTFPAQRLQDNACPIIGPDGTIYQPTENLFYAIRPDGNEKWKVSLGSGMRCAPALSSDGKKVYAIRFGTSDWKYYVAALSTVDGSILWEYPLHDGSDVSYSSLAVDRDGVIYVGARVPEALYAVNPDGTLKWKYQNPEATIYGMESPPTVSPEGLVCIGSNYEGIVIVDSTGQKINNWGEGSYWCVMPIDVSGRLYLSRPEPAAVYPEHSLIWRRWAFSIGACMPGIALAERQGLLCAGDYEKA